MDSKKVTLKDLKALAKDRGIKGYSSMRKDCLTAVLFPKRKNLFRGGFVVTSFSDLKFRGGFLVDPTDNNLYMDPISLSPIKKDDVYILRENPYDFNSLVKYILSTSDTDEIPKVPLTGELMTSDDIREIAEREVCKRVRADKKDKLLNKADQVEYTEIYPSNPGYSSNSGNET